MEPVTWGVLAASTATWTVKKLANLATGTAWKEKVEPAFKKSGLDHELALAYEAAFTAFVEVLRGPFVIDDAMDARLREMFADDGFQAILAELPRSRFEDVDTARASELFAGLGLPGATTEDFDFAWRSFGRAFVYRIAQTTHAAKLAKLSQRERVESLLTELLAASVHRRDESAARAAYRRYVDGLYRLADTRGLFWHEKETTGEEILLADIFVETLLQRQDSHREIAAEEDNGERRPEDDGERAHVLRSFREEPRTVAEVLAEERRLVILGPPGSGKTTLARCLALALVTEEVPLATGLPAETVPILLEMKTYAASLKERSNLRLDTFLERHLGQDLPELSDILASGEVLVLFDGLDEVFDEAHRRWVSAEVSRLMSRYPRARFVLTSRPLGYRAVPLTGAVPVFEMVDFNDERIRRFFRGWFIALARQSKHATGPTSEQQADGFADDVLRRPRIRSLAENPMLCTLILLVQSRSGLLPERRVKFYEEAVSVLTERWEIAKRSPKQEIQLNFPEPELMVGVLAEVAWRAQTELKGREIPADVLKKWLEGALADDPESFGKQKNAVRDLLHVIQDRTGLLVDEGSGRYQFVHLSLQEYLVALYLLSRLDEEQCSRVAHHFLHAPEWEEILRLTIGAAPRNRADALLRAILDEPTSEWEEISRRDLRFVCRCMEDRPNVSEAVRADVRSRWLKVLEDGSYDNEEALILDGVGLGLTPEIRAAFEARLDDDDFRVRRGAVEYFAQIGDDDEKTRTAFEACLAAGDLAIQRSAVAYFARIGAHDLKIRAAFEARLEDEDLSLRRSAVAYFGQIGADDEKTRVAIGARLGDDHWTVRETAVQYFAQIGADDEEIRGAIEHHIGDENPFVRRAAIEYFARIGADDEKTRAAVEARLGDNNEIVRRIAVYYFAKFGADDEETRTVFETRLGDDYGGVRRVAVEFFAMSGADDKKTRTAVEARLSDDDIRVRLSAVEYFARIGANDERTRAVIEARLTDDEALVRRIAVYYFAQIGADDDKTRKAIEARLQDVVVVREAAVAFFVATRLPDDATVVLEAYESLGFHLHFFIPAPFQKLNTIIGRRAATDNALLQRIYEVRTPHFYPSRALAAAAARRDELRREATPLSAVLAGTVPQQLPAAEPPTSLNGPLRMARLVVDHLRVFDHLALDLSSGETDAGQWALLLGDNAVGKTTLLRAIALACIEPSTSSALLELTGITAPFVRHQTDEASFTLRTSAGEIHCTITPNATSERLDRQGPILPGTVFAYGCQRGTAFGGPMRDVELRPIDNVGTLFDDNAHLIHAETWLQEASLAAVKGGAARSRFYDVVRWTLLSILPGVKTLDFDDNAQLWLDGPKIGRSPLAAMSDGYITTVGWVVDMVARWAELSHRLGVELDGDFRDKMTGLVLIDEIDLHLHPLWQTEIVSSLRAQFPKMSFVATTHNPLTLMGAKPGEIHVLRRDRESGEVSVQQQDILPGMSADDVLTGEWFGLVSTLDTDTRGLLEKHRALLRDGVAADDPGRLELEKKLRRRLGTFPSTSLDRMVQTIAAELMEGDFRRKTPEERRKIRQQILERARKEKAELSP